MKKNQLAEAMNQICILLVYSLAITSLSTICFAQNSNSNFNDVKALVEKFDGEITTHFPSQSNSNLIKGETPDLKALGNYLPLFSTEISLYPPCVIKNSGIKTIVFCQNLLRGSQATSGIADLGTHTLYLDVDSMKKDRIFPRRVVHHEIMHFIDGKSNNATYEKMEWEHLNSKGFKYSGGDTAHLLEPTILEPLDPTLTGFVNKYSMTEVEEDKAELFAHMMTHICWVNYKAEYDSVLKLKTEKLRKLLTKFSPSLNEHFWAIVTKHIESERADSTNDEEQIMALEAAERLSESYAKQGKYTTAIAMLKRSLELQEHMPSIDRTAITESLLKLARLYVNQHEYEKAELLYARALSMAEKVWTPNSEKLLLLIREYAKLLRTMNFTEKATALELRTKIIRSHGNTFDSH